MAVTDLWFDKSRKPTSRHGRGKRWRVTVPGRPSRAFATKVEAQAWERKLWEQRPEGPEANVTVGELVDRWLEGKRGLAPGSYELCVYAAQEVRAKWSGLPASQLTRAEAQAWIAGLGVSASTKRRARQALGGALTIAVEAEVIPRNWAPQLRIAEGQSREPRYLSVDELHRLADASEMPDAVLLLGTCGPRLSEGFSLQVGDVAATRKVEGELRPRLRVREAKNRTARDVPIPLSVLGRLDLARPKEAPLLVHPKRGVITGYSFRRYVLPRAVERAGLGEMRPHDLRHTAVSLAIQAGANVKAIQRMVGHKTITVTLQTYGHLFDDTLDVVAQRMDALLTGKDRVRMSNDEAA